MRWSEVNPKHPTIPIHQQVAYHMSTATKTKLATQALAFVGALSLFAAASSSAALVADGTPFPGVPITGVNNFGGVALSDTLTNFAESGVPGPAYTGTLRTVVVQNGGGTLDFYYQLGNIQSFAVGVPPVNAADIFAFSIDNFDLALSNPATLDFSLNGLTGIAGANPFVIGNETPAFANRDPGIGLGTGVGFAFSIGLPGDPGNLNAGETSFFMVVRTNATAFQGTSANVAGNGGAVVATFGPALAGPGTAIPEPGSALVGLAVMGLCTSGLFRRNRNPVAV